jgi:VanZ family protein
MSTSGHVHFEYRTLSCQMGVAGLSFVRKRVNIQVVVVSCEYVFDAIDESQAWSSGSGANACIHQR